MLFVTLGWFEVHGIWAMLLIAVLVVEIVITLMDFVEEDLTRKLPASERIKHTLMALNYGAIVVLLLPILLGWAANADRDRAGLVRRRDGRHVARGRRASCVSGLRDFWRARMHAGSADAAVLVDALPARQHVLVTGATGFIGSRLVEALTGAGHDVTVLTRDPAKAAALRPPLRIVTDLAQIPTTRGSMP